MDKTPAWAPTAAQRLAKARFWDRIDGHWRQPESYSLAEIVDITGSQSVRTWAANSPEFNAWFFNKDFSRQKLVANVDLAVDELIKVLQETDVGPKGKVTAPAKVRAAEILLNYAGMAPVRKTEITAKTTQVQSMDPIELRQFLVGHVQRLFKSMSPDEIREMVGDDAIDKLTALEGELVDEAESPVDR